MGFIKPAHAAPHNFQATKENIFDETDYNQRMNLQHQESSTQYHSKILFLGSFPKGNFNANKWKISVIEQSFSYGFGYTFSKKMDLPKKIITTLVVLFATFMTKAAFSDDSNNRLNESLAAYSFGQHSHFHWQAF